MHNDVSLTIFEVSLAICNVIHTSIKGRKSKPYQAFLKVCAFLQEQFCKSKSLDLGKKFKNKLRTKPGLLSHRT